MLPPFPPNRRGAVNRSIRRRDRPREQDGPGVIGGLQQARYQRVLELPDVAGSGFQADERIELSRQHIGVAVPPAAAFARDPGDGQDRLGLTRVDVEAVQPQQLSERS